jgi:hypothetical protein
VSLALYRAVDSKFDIAGSLVQQGFLALRQGDPARAAALQREPAAAPHLPPVAVGHQGPGAPAARLAGVLAGADGTLAAAPPELSGIVRSSADQIRTGCVPSGE